MTSLWSSLISAEVEQYEPALVVYPVREFQPSAIVADLGICEDAVKQGRALDHLRSFLSLCIFLLFPTPSISLLALLLPPLSSPAHRMGPQIQLGGMRSAVSFFSRIQVEPWSKCHFCGILSPANV